MASSKIKGITIEIGGETTKLGQALQSVESQSKSLQSELKGVNTLLKMDPGNVELLKQKQDLLTQSISSTKEKLDALKSTMSQITSGNVTVTEEQFRDLQREIVLTEQKLGNLETETKNFGSVSEQQIAATSKKMEEYGDKAQKAGDKISNSGKSMLGLSVGIAGVTTAGVMYNMEMETLSTNLEVLLGSTDAANKRLEELRTMGAKTPFETTDLVAATQKMLAFGLDADKTNGYLQVLGDISMGDANKLDSLTLAFSQIGSAGKATMEDINQMIDQGFNPLTYIAQTTGESMSEVRDRVSEGKVSFQEIADAMKKATSEGGPFYQSMDKASQTTAGKISTLKDSFNTMIGTLTESLMPTFEKIVDKLSEFTQWFSKLNPKTQEFIIKAALIVAALGPILIFIGKIISSINIIIPLLTKLVPIFTTIKTALSGLFTLIMANPVIAIVVGIIAIIVLLYTKCEWFRNGIKAIFDFLKNIFFGVIDFFKNNWQTILLFILNPFAGAFKLLYDKCTVFRDFINNIVESIKTIFFTMVSWLNTYLVQPILIIFQSIANFINQYLIQPIMSLLNDYIIPIISKIIEIITKLVEIIFSLYIGIALWLYQNVIQPIINYVVGLFNKIVEIVSSIWNKIVEVFSKIASWIYDNVIQPVINAITSFKNSAINVFTAIWDKITSIFGSVGSWFGSRFSEAYNTVTSIFSRIGTFFGGIWDSIKNKFSSLGTSIGNSISDAVKSGINGVISLIEGTINKAIGLINGAINLINKLPGVKVGKIGNLSLPRLATGDVAMPNKPYYAMLGDNKTQKEVISPVGTMRDTMMDALTDFTNIRTQGSSEIQTLTNLMDKYMPQILSNIGQNIVLDDGTLVGKIALKVDTKLGELTAKRKRGY